MSSVRCGKAPERAGRACRQVRAAGHSPQMPTAQNVTHFMREAIRVYALNALCARWPRHEPHYR